MLSWDRGARAAVVFIGLFALLALPARAMKGNKCPTGETYKSWLDAEVDELINKGAAKAPAKAAHAAIVECEKTAKKKDQFKACVKRLEHVAEALGREGQGLDKANAQYFEAHKAKMAIPSKLANADLFAALKVANLSKPATIDKVVGDIKKLYGGALVVPYLSMNTPAFDNGGDFDQHGRIVARIEDNGLVHYVQFTVNASADNKRERVQTSILNFEAASGAYAWDYERDHKTNKFETAPAGNDVRCYQCHASGVLAIHPMESYMTSDIFKLEKEWAGIDLKEIDKINRKYEDELGQMNKHIVAEYTTLYEANKGIVGAPATKVDGSVVPDPLKTPSSGCSGEEIKAFNTLIPKRTNPPAGLAWWTDWAKYLVTIGGHAYTYTPAKGETDVYRCTHCHEDRGASLFHKSNYDAIISKYVLGGFMPPDADEYRKDSAVIKPNTTELKIREEVKACFEKSYFSATGPLASWLKAPCDKL
jgi:exonuclease VII small subunit